MASLGPLAFAVPWALVALVVLPLLWWLLRAVPPRPRRVSLPTIRFLFGLTTDRRTAETTPLWLILLRMALVSLLILAVAHPIVTWSGRSLDGGDMLVVVDDGWAAGRNWPARLAALEDLVDLADREDRLVVLMTTAPAADGAPFRHSGLLTADDAAGRVLELAPHPWPTDRQGAAEALVGLGSIGHVFWLADDIADPGDGILVAALEALGDLTVMTGTGRPALLLPEPDVENGELVVEALRSDALGDMAAWVVAEDSAGRLVARLRLDFASGSGMARTTMALPLEVRNSISRLAIENETTAAAVALLDQRWKRPSVGLVAGGDIEVQHSLLSPTYFLSRALEQDADVRQDTLGRLLDRPPAVMVLADIGTVAATMRPHLEDWLATGGVLVRFAGPAFSRESDDLLPVALRARQRALGGVMSWSRPQRIAEFDAASPFFGLEAPPDVLVDRQVLAEPTADLSSKTWARLEDGTPLVTAGRRGDGWLVLIHTTANTQWTNLPLSGLFAGMIRRLALLAEGSNAGLDDVVLPALVTLDGFGNPAVPEPHVSAIVATDIADVAPGPRHPPGIYGTSDLARAVNLGSRLEPPDTLTLPDSVTVTGLTGAGDIDLRPFLLGLVLLVAFLEIASSMVLRGIIPSFARQSAAAAILLAIAATASATMADEDPTGVPEAVLDVRFGYVTTGDPRVDRTSKAGLSGLGAILTARTSIEPGQPVALSLETDNLVLHPLIYWPITIEQPVPTASARARLDAYLATGGILVVDTRDADRNLAGLSGVGPNAARLPDMLRGLNIPALMRVAPGHVLTQSYYLLQDFPGRWTGGATWVEQHPGGLNDGVSSIIIGSNDWAGAWALNNQLQPLHPAVPGGERQREMAFRFGVNLAMYALTGNYKADAVHLPIILERLGQ